MQYGSPLAPAYGGLCGTKLDEWQHRFGFHLRRVPSFRQKPRMKKEGRRTEDEITGSSSCRPEPP